MIPTLFAVDVAVSRFGAPHALGAFLTLLLNTIGGLRVDVEEVGGPVEGGERTEGSVSSWARRRSSVLNIGISWSSK